jgi:predicted enzyme related to lactoylglutathione lyase
LTHLVERREPTRHLVAVILAGLALAVASVAQEPASPADRDAHGGFTGDVKPVIYVSDVEKAAAFYRDTLGFTFEGFSDLHGEPYYAEMVAGGRRFGLHEPTSEREKERVGKLKLYFRVRDLAAHRRRVAAWGGSPGPLRETPWMNMFSVHDADGNEIVFATTDPAVQTTDPW